MRQCTIIVTIMVSLGYFCALYGRELRRRDLGDVVGNQAEELRESLDDMMEHLARSVGGAPLSEADVEALMALGRLEGELSALSALARNGRTQNYRTVMDAINKSTEAAAKALNSLRIGGPVRNDWLRLQMDLRQLELSVQKTAPAR